VVPDARRDPQGLDVIGPGFTMRLAGRGDRSDPLGLTDKSVLILQSQQPTGSSRSRSIGAAAARTLPFKQCTVANPVAVTSGTGFKPDSQIILYFLPATTLGEVTTDASGSFTGSVPIPPGIALGSHTLQVNGYSAEGQVRSLSIGVIVEPTVPAKAGSSKAKVFFDSMSPEITPAGAATLNSLVAKARKKGIRTVVVGFVQESGIAANDQSLSTQRARNVTAYLRERGLAGSYETRGDGVSRIASASAIARRVNVSVTYHRPC
jgi:outer membrane protein OmpA-like peptidoglycan-associated protein